MGVAALFKKIAHAFKDWPVQALSAIVSLSLFLRLYQLGAESIWQDEGFSIRFASFGVMRMLREVASLDLNPPLHLFVLHYWIELFGHSEFSARLPSAIVGILAVILVYKLASLLFDKEVGLISALLLAMSQFAVYYSQEARAYSLMVFLTLLSLYFYLRLLNENRLWIVAGYILSSVLLLYTHLFGAFILVVQNVHYLTLLLSKNGVPGIRARRWMLYQASLLAMFMPWLWVVYSRLSLLTSDVLSLGSWSIPKPTIQSILKTFVAFSSEPFLLLIFAGLVAILVADVFEARHRQNDKPAGRNTGSIQHAHGIAAGATKPAGPLYLLLLWLFAPLSISFVVSRFSVPVYSDKYLIETLPAFYILAAAGLKAINYKYVKAAALVLVCAISISTTWQSYSDVRKEPWRDAAALVDAHALPGDLVVFNIASCQVNCFDYYSKRTDLKKRSLRQDAISVDKQTISELASYLEGRTRIWCVLLGDLDNGKLTREILADQFSYGAARHRTFFSTGKYPIDVYLFVKLPS